LETGHGYKLEPARSAAPCEDHRWGRAARRLSRDYRAATLATRLIAAQRGTLGLFVHPTDRKPRPPGAAGHWPQSRSLRRVRAGPRLRRATVSAKRIEIATDSDDAATVMARMKATPVSDAYT